jgi:hypothetical protein
MLYPYRSQNPGSFVGIIVSPRIHLALFQSIGAGREAVPATTTKSDGRTPTRRLSRTEWGRISA